MARVLGNHTQAETFYDRAIRLSKKEGYLIKEAIACELAFKYYKLQGKEKSNLTPLVTCRQQEQLHSL